MMTQAQQSSYENELLSRLEAEYERLMKEQDLLYDQQSADRTEGNLYGDSMQTYQLPKPTPPFSAFSPLKLHAREQKAQALKREASKLLSHLKTLPQTILFSSNDQTKVDKLSANLQAFISPASDVRPTQPMAAMGSSSFSDIRNLIPNYELHPKNNLQFFHGFLRHDDVMEVRKILDTDKKPFVIIYGPKSSGKKYFTKFQLGMSYALDPYRKQGNLDELANEWNIIAGRQNELKDKFTSNDVTTIYLPDPKTSDRTELASIINKYSGKNLRILVVLNDLDRYANRNENEFHHMRDWIRSAKASVDQKNKIMASQSNGSSSAVQSSSSQSFGSQSSTPTIHLKWIVTCSKQPTTENLPLLESIAEKSLTAEALKPYSHFFDFMSDQDREIFFRIHLFQIFKGSQDFTSQQHATKEDKKIELFSNESNNQDMKNFLDTIVRLVVDESGPSSLMDCELSTMGWTNDQIEEYKKNTRESNASYGTIGMPIQSYVQFAAYALNQVLHKLGCIRLERDMQQCDWKKNTEDLTAWIKEQAKDIHAKDPYNVFNNAELKTYLMMLSEKIGFNVQNPSSDSVCAKSLHPDFKDVSIRLSWDPINPRSSSAEPSVPSSLPFTKTPYTAESLFASSSQQQPASSLISNPNPNPTNLKPVPSSTNSYIDNHPDLNLVVLQQHNSQPNPQPKQ